MGTCQLPGAGASLSVVPGGEGDVSLAEKMPSMKEQQLSSPTCYPLRFGERKELGGRVQPLSSAQPSSVALNLRAT